MNTENYTHPLLSLKEKVFAYVETTSPYLHISAAPPPPTTKGFVNFAIENV